MTRDQTETMLAQAAAAGDEVAFARLCRQMRGWLHQRAGRFYGPGLEHDDLLQEARIGLFKACRGWNGSAPFPAFAVLVVDRHLATAVKMAQAGKHSPLNDSVRFEQPADDDWELTLADVVPAPACTDPAVIVETRCELRLVLDAVSRFTAMESTVLVRRLNGASYEQAGAGLGRLPARTADNALARGRRRIAAALDEAA